MLRLVDPVLLVLRQANAKVASQRFSSRVKRGLGDIRARSRRQRTSIRPAPGLTPSAIWCHQMSVAYSHQPLRVTPLISALALGHQMSPVGVLTLIKCHPAASIPALRLNRLKKRECPKTRDQRLDGWPSNRERA